MIPKDALSYLQNKKLRPAFSYRDVWNEEHAANFTVATAMQIDVLSDIHEAVIKAMEQGQTFEHFKKYLKPTLMKKGWWGKKEMEDPVTGKTVNAQLGSDRRLKLIYQTNMRSAYDYGRYVRAMESTAHPYFLWRLGPLGPSGKHMKEHVEWEGTLLPKDDPWWDSHFGQRHYYCRCRVIAVSEIQKERLEKNGITVPPTVDGQPGYKVPVRTTPVPDEYYTWVDERTGRIEQIPKGVGPGFNWNVGKRGRTIPNFETVIRKAQQKTPEQYDRVIESLLTNTVNKTKYFSFIEDALKKGELNRSDDRNAIGVGFLDQKLLKALKKEGNNLEANSLIILEEGLVNNIKFRGRHSKQGNAPTEEDWYNLIDYLIDAQVFLDDNMLLYLIKRNESKYLKIAVDLSFQHKGHKGTKLLLPKVDSMYELNLDTEGDRGIAEYKRLMKLKKIR